MLSKTLKCGFSMPAFGMGTWLMGGRFEKDPANDDARDTAAIKLGLEAGLTLIDTAEIYGGGFAEKFVGDAISGCDRSKLFITSKVWKTDLSYDGVLRAAEGSLKRLRTDYMDLCLIHQVNEDFPLKKTIRALDRLVDGKLVRNIGVSNFKVERLREAQAHSDNKIAVNQVHYSLVCREPEPELLPFCQSNDIILQAWRPLQGEGIVKNTCGIVKTMCEKYSATPSQIALAWLIAQPNVTTMSTMRSPEHLRENADCVRIKLDPEDVERLRREFPGRQTVSFAVPLK